MKKLLIMDEKNYPSGMEEIHRVAVRGLIFLEGKLLMIEDSSGEVKLPGGGLHAGEDEVRALIREVREETGYDVLPDTVQPFGEIEEKRLSTREPMVWHQLSRLYFCEVSPIQGQCAYSENEKSHGFRPVRYSIEDALEKNRQMLEKEGKQAWNQREYKTLLLIRDHFSGRD